MSKQYLTQKQALQKADQDASKASYWFSTKKWLIDQGVFDTSKLTKYDNEDFFINMVKWNDQKKGYKESVNGMN